MYKILVINPGSTSTKIGVFEDETLVFEKTLRHSTEEIAQFESIADQKDFRKQVVLDALQEANISLDSLAAVVGRGGLLKPIVSGTYETTEELLKDSVHGVQGEHASNLGAILAHDIAAPLHIPSYIVDPVCVDELSDVARISGSPAFERTSIFHALNQKAVAKRYAKEKGTPYADLNLIVVHMGGGVSVGAHDHGRVVDVCNALDGDGAFSPERVGGVPNGQLIKLCFSGKYTQKEITKMFVGNGGFNAYLGTNDMREVAKMAKTDPKAKLVREAFIYQVCKDVGAMATVLCGKVDQIILTGGIAYGQDVCDEIKARVGFIAPITVYPGEDELLALAQGALRVLKGEEKALKY